MRVPPTLKRSRTRALSSGPYCDRRGSWRDTAADTVHWNPAHFVQHSLTLWFRGVMLSVADGLNAKMIDVVM